MPVIEVGATRVSYADDGPSDGPTVIFGPGLLVGGWSYRAQVDALSHRYRCITLDWRGQGGSASRCDGYDMDRLTGDVVALIERLAVGPVHFVGLSMGGFVGQRLAARRPDLVSSLILLNTIHRRAHRKETARFEVLAALQLVLSARTLVTLMAPTMFGPHFLADPARTAVFAEWTNRLKTRNRRTARRAVRGVGTRESFVDHVGGIAVPTLVVTGADDKNITLGEAAELADAIPGATLKVFHDCGHICSLEQPKLLADTLIEFIAAVEGRYDSSPAAMP